MIFILLFTTLFAFGDAPRKWENAKSIVERHEFYQNGEVIQKPASSWQVLFALTFLDSRFHVSKDCVYYRVPGDEPGKLKIKTLPADIDCGNEILAPGDSETDLISSLSFRTEDRSVTLSFTREGKTQEWLVTTMEDWSRPEPKLLLSSADYKSPRMIYLAPAPGGEKNFKGIKDGVLCHDISSDCSEKSPSRCGDCEHGWMEIPNGCAAGPKVCGPLKCGGKDQPACRRGMNWQRKEMTFDCRTNTSFAWCSQGLSITCDGDKAWCR